MEPAKIITTLGDLLIGSRILIRSKKDWRTAVVSRKTEEMISISVASPTGCNYRVRRAPDLVVDFDGDVPYLKAKEGDVWRKNYSKYDIRW